MTKVEELEQFCKARELTCSLVLAREESKFNLDGSDYVWYWLGQIYAMSKHGSQSTILCEALGDTAELAASALLERVKGEK